MTTLSSVWTTSSEVKFWSKRLRGWRLVAPTSTMRRLKALRDRIAGTEAAPTDGEIPFFLRRSSPALVSSHRLEDGPAAPSLAGGDTTRVEPPPVACAEPDPQDGKVTPARDVLTLQSDEMKAQHMDTGIQDGAGLRQQTSVPDSRSDGLLAGDLIAPRKERPAKSRGLEVWFKDTVHALLFRTTASGQDTSERVGGVPLADNLVVALAFLLFLVGSNIGGLALVVVLLIKMRR